MAEVRVPPAAGADPGVDGAAAADDDGLVGAAGDPDSTADDEAVDRAAECRATDVAEDGADAPDGAVEDVEALEEAECALARLAGGLRANGPRTGRGSRPDDGMYALDERL